MEDTRTQLVLNGQVLPVMEMFYSIQGEGYHTGKPAFFIRIGGCDVGCAWCDVKESWKASLHPLYSIEEIMTILNATPATAVVLTGGEPYKYNLKILTEALTDKGYSIFVETSGTEPVSGKHNWICLSPKHQQQPEPEIWRIANELKVVIHSDNDFSWAEECRKMVAADCKLYMQPEWSVHKTLTPRIIEYVKVNTHWALSLQTHKYLNIP